jgi:hypothetical protein
VCTVGRGGNCCLEIEKEMPGELEGESIERVWRCVLIGVVIGAISGAGTSVGVGAWDARTC